MKKKLLIIGSVALVVLAIIASFLIIFNNDEEDYELQQERLAWRFSDQNFAFRWLVSGYREKAEACGVAFPSQGYLPVSIAEPNMDGTATLMYMYLVLYERKTGNILTYEQILDYLSQEFEDDGEIRIYTNGRHPEIADFIRWASNTTILNDTVWPYFTQMVEMYREYFEENEETPRFESINLIPVEMYMELLKVVENPNHVLDLTSFINRYIAEGRAWVGEDGITLEFDVPPPRS